MISMWVRTLSTSAVACRLPTVGRSARRRIPNPGVQNRIQAMKQDGMDTAIGPDMNIDDTDTDIYNLRTARKELEKEAGIDHKKLKYRIVKQKYSEEQFPNLLTWSEKEQIRHLHKCDPEEWSPEKIVECFPVTLEGARKLIAVVWLPASEQRISRHDKSALRNWRELKEGTLEGITPDLREKLMKFSKRVIPPRSDEAILATKKIVIQKPVSNVFGSIVANYKLPEDLTRSEPKLQIGMIGTTNESIEMSSAKQIQVNKNNHDHDISKHVTLEDFRSTLSTRVEYDSEIPTLDKLILSPKEALEFANQNNTEQVEPSIKVVKSETKLNRFNPSKQSEDLGFKEKIIIPRKAWKKGGTYKVHDCFYDADGYFLYRVPGMSGNVPNSES